FLVLCDHEAEAGAGRGFAGSPDVSVPKKKERPERVDEPLVDELLEAPGFLELDRAGDLISGHEAIGRATGGGQGRGSYRVLAGRDRRGGWLNVRIREPDPAEVLAMRRHELFDPDLEHSGFRELGRDQVPDRVRDRINEAHRQRFGGLLASARVTE